MKPFLIAAALAALALPAAAQQGPSGERLLMSPPPGWTPMPTQRGDKVATTRILPPGQTPENYSEMLTVQVYPGKEGDARGYVESVLAYSRANCEQVGPSPVSEASINGYPMASVTVACTKGKSTGAGGFALVQAIRGTDALYVVQRLWRGKPFSPDQPLPVPREMLQDWSAFGRTVGLCDSRDNRHPCPR